jgi:hypothetical protein
MIIQLNDRDIQLEPYLTIGKYQKLIKELELLKQDPIKVLSLYLDVPINELRDLPKQQVDFIEKIISSKLLEEPTKELTYTFEYQGISYGLENDWKKLAWGAWQDFEILSSENITDNIHHLMAILYRPTTQIKGTKYNIVPYKSAEIGERAELFKELPIQYWFGVSGFFLLLVKLYTIDINNSLKWMNKMNQLMMKGWTMLPNWVQRRLPLASILVYHYPLLKKT